MFGSLFPGVFFFSLVSGFRKLLCGIGVLVICPHPIPHGTCALQPGASNPFIRVVYLMGNPIVVWLAAVCVVWFSLRLVKLCANAHRSQRTPGPRPTAATLALKTPVVCTCSFLLMNYILNLLPVRPCACVADCCSAASRLCAYPGLA